MRFLISLLLNVVCMDDLLVVYHLVSSWCCLGIGWMPLLRLPRVSLVWHDGHVTSIPLPVWGSKYNSAIIWDTYNSMVINVRQHWKVPLWWSLTNTSWPILRSDALVIFCFVSALFSCFPWLALHGASLLSWFPWVALHGASTSSSAPTPLSQPGWSPTYLQ